MSLGINSCQFAGNLGADPKLTTTESGIIRVTFSLAVTETWKDKSGQKQEHTEWLNVQAWRKQAEVLGAHLKKGDPIFIVGKYRTREYEKDGQTQRFRFIDLKEFHFLPNPKKQQVDASTTGREVADDDIPF